MVHEPVCEFEFVLKINRNPSSLPPIVELIIGYIYAWQVGALEWE